MEFTDEGEVSEELSGIPAGYRKQALLVGHALKSYLRGIKRLLETKYAHLRETAPIYMTAECLPTVFWLNDGVLVRWDLVSNPELKVRVAFLEETLTKMAPLLSESVLHCPVDATGFDPSTVGLTLKMTKNEVNGSRTELWSTQIAVVAPLGGVRASPGDRPHPFASVENEFDLFIEGEIQPENRVEGHGFVLTSRLRLPVGWQKIDVYSSQEALLWDAERALTWAELDLLAAAARRHLLDSQLRDVDPNAAARKRVSSLLSEFSGVLAGPEEAIHQFIRSHPEILSPTYTAVWSKLPLGNRATDFVFRDATGDYLLVELERATHQLFREDGQIREPLTHAIDQIVDWRRYLEDNVRTVQQELGLTGISVNPRCLVVIGRSGGLTEENKRKLLALENATPRLRILTYDDVHAAAKATAENLLGPMWDPGEGVRVFLTPKRREEKGRQGAGH